MAVGQGPTQFVELNDVLSRLVDGARDALADNFLGAYLVGSFALGDPDMHSDCDFIVATRGPISAEHEAAIRRLHRQFPSDDGHWSRHLEGSYAPVDDLRGLVALGRDWLFVDHGHAEMEWSTHCNSPEHRWTLRHHGVVLAGPPPEEFADVPPWLLRDRMRAQIPRFMADLATWIRIDEIAWAQRYAVTTLCRMLFTVRNNTLTSKRQALLWAADELDSRWQELVLRAERERVRGWDPADLPDRELVEQTEQFADYVTRIAAGPMAVDDEDLLREQQAFYRARAPEYDQWWQGRGRYARGDDQAREWERQVSIVEAALAAFAPKGDVLELAGGTGWWTERLARTADRLTVVDGSPEVLELNRARVGRLDVDYVVADLFAWRPHRSFDVVFFSFWLSHVPRARFGAFWQSVRACLAPGGRVFLVDNRSDPTPGHVGRDPYVLEYRPDLHLRRLGDGSEYRVVKVTYEPEELAGLLRAEGWESRLQATQWFTFGSASASLSNPVLPSS